MNTQISYIIKSIEKIDEKTKLSEDLIETIKSIPKRSDRMIAACLPYIQNGNSPQASLALIAFIDWLFFSLNPILDWKTLKNPASMPKSLASRISAIEKRISQIEPENELLEDKIRTINDAYAAADDLPERRRSGRSSAGQPSAEVYLWLLSGRNQKVTRLSGRDPTSTQ